MEFRFNRSDQETILRWVQDLQDAINYANADLRVVDHTMRENGLDLGNQKDVGVLETTNVSFEWFFW